MHIVKCSFLLLMVTTLYYTDSRPQHTESPVVLPNILHQSVVPKKENESTTRQKPLLPKFSFSKTELQSLACFRDEEVAEQVLEWLEMQGKLSDT